MNRKGVSRIKTYEIHHHDVPAAFNGFKIALASDFHYKSMLQLQGLEKVVNQLQQLQADVLLLTGDYVGNCELVQELFSSLAQVVTPFGTYAVLGNHDYNKCYDDVVSAITANNITLLEHTTDTLTLNDSEIIIAGVRNPFNITKNGVSPTVKLNPDDYVILLSHTPDYAEKGNITNTDLVVAGHTHGGQITLFGFAPVTNSDFGQKFRSGKTCNSLNQTVIITNGIGSSRKRLRFCAPPEIVLITLKN